MLVKLQASVIIRESGYKRAKHILKWRASSHLEVISLMLATSTVLRTRGTATQKPVIATTILVPIATGCAPVRQFNIALIKIISLAY